MSRLPDPLGAARLIDAVVALPGKLDQLLEAIGELNASITEMSEDVSLMRQGVDALHREVAPLQSIEVEVKAMTADVNLMRAGVDDLGGLGDKLELLSEDLRRLPFVRRRGAA